MVSGLRSLKRKLTHKIPKAVRAAATKALEKNADEIVDYMRRLAPVLEGGLVQSIGWTWGATPSGATAIVSGGAPIAGALRITIYAGGGDEFYAWFQEFGTVDMPPSPFFFPAYRGKKSKAKGRLTRAINKAIKSGAR